MRHHRFTTDAAPSTYNIAVLAKSTAFNHSELFNNYVDPLVKKGINAQDIIAFTLKYNDAGKAPATFIKAYLDKLLPALDSLGVKYLYVTDANYFKTLTKQGKAEVHFGYELPCKYPKYEHMKVVLGINYQALIYNPALQSKLDMSIDTLIASVSGSYVELGTDIIHSAYYPETVEQIKAALASLHQYPELTCDIEAFSLEVDKAGIGTIAFAWDKHNGLAFACDYKEIWDKHGCYDRDCNIDIAAFYGYYKPNKVVRQLLLEFFLAYKGKLIFHNATYDVKVLICYLWMTDLLDTEGLLDGLGVMTRAMEDTKIIAYLATNSTAGNVLGLKALAHEFAGNWAKDDIKDIRKIPLSELLKYNLVDALSTHYVKEKYYPIMVQDNQETLYREQMLPSLKTIIQMELTGMPMSKAKIQEIKVKLEGMQEQHLGVIHNSGVIKTLNLLLQQSGWEKDLADRQAKAKNPLNIKAKDISAFADKVFNPNSGPQLQRLLYEQMGLPIIDLTDTKQPATGAETIEKLINHTQEPAYKELLSALIGYGKVNKILSTFIPAFENAITKADDGIVWLHGSFNLGGTVSGRLSSSDPNLQNIPANSIFGKLIKEAFQAPKGWLMCGADFNSLEDYISALTTKDTNKLRVYTDGYDGHCLRAFYYFHKKMPDLAQEMTLLPTDRVFKITKEDGSLYYAKRFRYPTTFRYYSRGTV